MFNKGEWALISFCIAYRYKKLVDSQSKKIKPSEKAAELAALFDLHAKVKKAIEEQK